MDGTPVVAEYGSLSFWNRENATYIQQAHITPNIDNSTATFDVTIGGEIASGTELQWECDGMNSSIAAAEKDGVHR